MTSIEAIQQTTRANRILPEDPRGPRPQPQPSESAVMQKEMRGAGERKDESSGARSGESRADATFSDQFLDAIEQDLSLLHNVGISFSLHKETGRTMVRVFDKETDTLIREIPPEEFLDLAAKIHEMVGVLFDKRV